MPQEKGPNGLQAKRSCQFLRDLCVVMGVKAKG